MLIGGFQQVRGPVEQKGPTEFNAGSVELQKEPAPQQAGLPSFDFSTIFCGGPAHPEGKGKLRWGLCSPKSETLSSGEKDDDRGLEVPSLKSFLGFPSHEAPSSGDHC